MRLRGDRAPEPAAGRATPRRSRVPGSHERLKWSQPLPGANERALMSAHERSRMVKGIHERS